MTFSMIAVKLRLVVKN